MAKRLLFLHLGPEPVDVDAMRAGLTVGQVVVPDVPAEVLVDADLEIRRAHKAAGRKRKEVAGAWARTVRRTFKAKSDAFLSMPGFLSCTAEQAALAYDALAGLKVVLVATTGFEQQVPDAWRRLVKPERVHVLPTGLDSTALADQVARIALVEQQARTAKRLRKVRRRLAA